MARVGTGRRTLGAPAVSRIVMQHEIDDVRIQNIRPLMAPEILIEDLPVGERQNETI